MKVAILNYIFLFSFPFLGVIINTNATSFQYGNTVSLDTAILSDVYISCRQLNVNAPITGDLIAAAQSIYVRNSISGDLLAAGEILDVSGSVNDDIRAFARTFNLSSSVKGDLIIFCSEASILKDAIIEGDLIVYSGNVVVEGIVKGNIKIYGGTVKLNSIVEGNAFFTGGELIINGDIKGNAVISAEKIELGNNATFSGNVRYWQSSGPFKTALTKYAGSFIFDPTLQDEQAKENGKYWYKLGIAFSIWHLLFGILMIFLLNLLFKNSFIRAGQNMKADPGKSFAYGLLYFFLMPFLILFLLVSIIGIPLGIFLMVFYIFTFVTGIIVTSLVLAFFINNTYAKGWQNWGIIGVSILILIGLKLILLIPFVGFLFLSFLVCSAFGSLFINYRREKNPVRFIV
jgi:cytoskeletal protein CcmA (bactofilin family)